MKGLGMILVDKQIGEVVAAEHVRIDSFEAKQIQPASYDLRVGAQGISTTSKQVVNIKEKGYFELRPGDFAVVLTREVLSLDIKPIKTDADYRAALKEIESLMMAGPDTPEGEKLDVLVTLMEAYEARNFPMDLPDPVEAIKFEMERKGLTVKDLEPMIGKSNRVYEILNHKRSLTLKMIWKLHEGLGIPAESLIKPPQAHA